MKLHTPARMPAWAREAADKLPPSLIRAGQHGGYKPSTYELLWVVTEGDVAVAFATCLASAEVLHFRGCGVIPAYRGRGLQRRLLGARLRYARAHGFAAVRTYTAVDNKYSMANVIRSGFCPSRVEDYYVVFERRM